MPHNRITPRTYSSSALLQHEKLSNTETPAIPLTVQERVIACFKALATGDAIGKQTETLSAADVRRWYQGGIMGFHGQPGAVTPRYAGKRYEWRTGETTDDTEQTLAVARALKREGRASHQAIGQELLQCRKSLHPGVSLWTFVQIGDPSRIASEGDFRQKPRIYRSSATEQNRPPMNANQRR